MCCIVVMEPETSATPVQKVLKWQGHGIQIKTNKKKTFHENEERDAVML